MKAENVLNTAMQTVASRRKSYGDARKLFEMVAHRWSITLGAEITEQEVILCMLDLKMARLANQPKHFDSIVDIAGYAACLGEIV